MLKSLSPAFIINSYNDTIKQNSAGDITFICNGSKVEVFVENHDYNYSIGSLYNDGTDNNENGKYIGTFTPYKAE